MKEDIIRMVREAEIPRWCDHEPLTEDHLIRFAALVRADEREAILQMSAATWFKTQADYDAAIRARGQE